MSIVEQAKLQHVSPCSWSTGDQEKPTVAGSHQKRTVRWAIEVGRRPRPPLLQTSILTTLTLGSTITTSLLPTLFRKPSVNGTCWTKFPACDSTSLQAPTILPSLLRPDFTCETLLTMLCLVIFIHWTCISVLFQTARWRERYLPKALYAVVIGMIPAVYAVDDSAVLMLQVLPTISDICVVICLGLDCLSH
ncbi:hypothetical protein B0J15DRAFT_486604 [Fusarium solani]|uniref:Uncharacterized protein n=1 Tax=Fusarium solani TaxID=169388 RepID=A0A9P9KTS2_FUSSL|nr:uncharacterized protein B0J15DRAFT_486604 [Fusarium solani]KAH7268339.1 hypothetical protein B0J15DRAFT_486604 [Fusarium solani]